MTKTNSEEGITFKITYRGESYTGDPHYAREKLRAAVYKLAVGTGKIKERLADAYIELAIISEDDLPTDLWEELQAIRQKLTGGKMKYVKLVKDGQWVKEPMGLLKSTLMYMRYPTAQDIAKRICTLEAKVDDWIKMQESDK